MGRRRAAPDRGAPVLVGRAARAGARRAALRAATPRSGAAAAGPAAGADPAQPPGRGRLAPRRRPEAVCESGGVQYNSATKGLFRDLRRHLERAWAQYTGTDPFAGDVWQVALLDLQSNGSRRWPATQGIVDFGPIELPWLREVVKDWARDTRPYLQRLRETLRACQVASHTLMAAGRTDPASLGAGDFVLHRAGHRRATPHRRHSVLRLAPQPAALAVLPGHRARPRQRADDRGARPVPPRRAVTG